MESKQYHIMILAGETSGDHHAARLIQALRKTGLNFSVSGMGGPALKEEGMEILVDSEMLAVIGVTGVIAKLPVYLRALKTMKQEIIQRKPDLIISVDFPDFNLLVAKQAKKLKIPVLHYISPQIWAWRRGRIRKIKKRFDHMAVILPFEPDFYSSYDMPVTYVGHPMMDNEEFALDRLRMVASKENVIGFLPGSRTAEIKTHLPAMIEAARMIRKEKPDVQFLLSIPSEKRVPLIEDILTQENAQNLFQKETILTTMFKRSRFLISVSGTVTLQAAIWAVPTIIVYSFSHLNALIAAPLLRVKFIGLANLIAGKEVMPELVQYKMTAKNIYTKSMEWLNNPEELKMVRNELIEVREKVGEAGASDKLAQVVLKLLHVSTE